MALRSRNKMNRILTILILIALPLVTNGQEIDTTLLSSISKSFGLNKSVNIEFRYYSHHQFEDPINLQNLNTIILFLKKNENLKIELRCHSDCQGTIDYNLKLTQRQAENIKTWLVTNGTIDQARIRPIGKGGEFPIQECLECKCEENKRRINRRVEILTIE